VPGRVQEYAVTDARSTSSTETGRAQRHRPSSTRAVVEHAELKVAQLHMREAEIEEVVNVLRLIERGGEVFAGNSRGEGRDLHNWAGRLDLERMVLGGHSFGANTVVSFVRHVSWIVAVVIHAKTFIASSTDASTDVGSAFQGRFRIRSVCHPSTASCTTHDTRRHLLTPTPEANPPAPSTTQSLLRSSSSTPPPGPVLPASSTAVLTSTSCTRLRAIVV